MARGDAGAESDLDVGILLRDQSTRADEVVFVLADIASRVERYSPAGRVDVVLLEPQGPLFCHQVLLEGRCVYAADPDRRVDFESETYSRAFDFRPTFELATEDTVGAFRRWLQAPR